LSKLALCRTSLQSPLHTCIALSGWLYCEPKFSVIRGAFGYSLGSVLPS